jgi:rRNA small subunit pseudouridine methyltransferase Nep1
MVSGAGRDLYGEKLETQFGVPMISIVIAEAALETVPKEIADHPSVRKTADRRGKEPGQTLLDISYHYTAMKDLKDWDKRGRPDITFITLLNLLESPLNLEDRLRIYVHTRNDLIITIDSRTKLPRNYTRFQGLIEQLFEIGKIPPHGKPLMTLWKGTLKDVVAQVKPSKTFFLTEKGKKTKSEDFGSKIVKEDSPLIVIGGFQRGEFSKQDLGMADEKVSLYKDPLDTWIVASMVTHDIEKALGII